MELNIAELKGFGNYIKEKIAERGISVRAAAKEYAKMFLSDNIADDEYILSYDEKKAISNFHKWSGGKGRPSIDGLYQLSKYLGVTMEQLITAGKEESYIGARPTLLAIAEDKVHWESKFNIWLNNIKDKVVGIANIYDEYEKTILDYAIQCNNIELFECLVTFKEFEYKLKSMTGLKFVIENELYELFEFMEFNPFNLDGLRLWKRNKSEIIALIVNCNVSTIRKIFGLSVISFENTYYGVLQRIELVPGATIINFGFKDYLNYAYEQGACKSLEVLLEIALSHNLQVLNLLTSEEIDRYRPVVTVRNEDEFVDRNSEELFVISRGENGICEYLLSNIIDIPKIMLRGLETLEYSVKVKDLANKLNQCKINIDLTLNDTKNVRGKLAASLHLTTTKHNVDQLVALCKRKRLRVVSLLEMESISSQLEFCKKTSKIGIHSVLGVEIEFSIGIVKGIKYKDMKGKLLVYNYNYDTMKEILNDRINIRDSAYREIVRRLQLDGYNLSEDDFKLYPKLNKEILAKVLSDKMNVDVYDIYREKLNDAKYSVDDLTFSEALVLFAGTGGKAVLGYPYMVKESNDMVRLNNDELVLLLKHLKNDYENRLNQFHEEEKYGDIGMYILSGVEVSSQTAVKEDELKIIMQHQMGFKNWIAGSDINDDSQNLAVDTEYLTLLKEVGLVDVFNKHKNSKQW